MARRLRGVNETIDISIFLSHLTIERETLSAALEYPWSFSAIVHRSKFVIGRRDPLFQGVGNETLC